MRSFGIKRLISALLVLALALAFTACGDKTEEQDEYTYYDYDLSKYVALGQYEGIEMPAKEEAVVTDEEVQAYAERIAAQYPVYDKVYSGTVKDGDMVNIDFVGTVDGKEFEKGKTDPATGTTVTLGQGALLEDLEAAIIGHKVGDSFGADITFPASYGTLRGQPELDGAEAHFEITVNYLMEQNGTEEYNDDFVKAHTSYESVAEFNDVIYDYLLEQRAEEIQQGWEDELWSRVVDNATIKEYPEKEYTSERSEYITYYENYATTYGVDFSEYVASYFGSEDEFYAMADEYAAMVVESELVLFSIADKEGLRVKYGTPEYEAGKLEMIRQAGYESEEAFEEKYGYTYEDSMGIRNIITGITMNRVWEVVEGSAVIR